MFKKGHPQLNTGRTHFKKGIHYSPTTEFKKGQIPYYKLYPNLAPKGKNHPNWKGGKIFYKSYIFIHNPNHPFVSKIGYVREHRLVVEKQIGRYLKPSEKIHHLGAKTDNRPHLLMAFVNNSAHIRFEKNKIVNPEEIIFDGRKINR